MASIRRSNAGKQGTCTVSSGWCRNKWHAGPIGSLTLYTVRGTCGISSQPDCSVRRSRKPISNIDMESYRNHANTQSTNDFLCRPGWLWRQWKWVLSIALSTKWTNKNFAIKLTDRISLGANLKGGTLAFAKDASHDLGTVSHYTVSRNQLDNKRMKRDNSLQTEPSAEEDPAVLQPSLNDQHWDDDVASWTGKTIYSGERMWCAMTSTVIHQVDEQTQRTRAEEVKQE